jgi:hypothetical protein
MDARGTRVAVVHDGILSWKKVEIEGDFGDRLGIATGVADGEMVVAAPSDRLVEGMRVIAQEPQVPKARVAETKPP